jgi:hypothetical protein
VTPVRFFTTLIIFQNTECLIQVSDGVLKISIFHLRSRPYLLLDARVWSLCRIGEDAGFGERGGGGGRRQKNEIFFEIFFFVLHRESTVASLQIAAS